MTPALKKKTLHVQGSGEWAFVGVAGLALVCLRQTPLILFGGKLKAHSPEPPCGGPFLCLTFLCEHMTPALKKMHVQGSGEWAFVGVAGFAYGLLLPKQARYRATLQKSKNSYVAFSRGAKIN
jgi:hypothetical protein